MAKPLRTKPVSKLQARAFVGKAQEFIEAAADELEAGRYIASLSLSIHAAINAADAVCGARMGMRAAGDDHMQVVALLRQVGTGGAIATELTRLLPLKTRAEYEPDDIAPSVAAKAFERAARCVLAAHLAVL